MHTQLLLGVWLDRRVKTFGELEVSCLRFLTPLKGKRLLVAVSGGRDSVLLFHLLKNLAPKLELKLSVGHVYHGHSEFRREAFEFVRELAGESFVSNVESAPGGLVSSSAPPAQDAFGNEFPREDEQSLRVFRRSALLAMCRLTKSDFIVLGHHRDDLMETRLIRLIRGTGPEGIKSMSRKSRLVLRPLLPFWRDQIEAASLDLNYVEDPSNLSSRHLRNWIRNEWLVQLEAYRPGGKKSLGRSLENLTISSRKNLDELKLLLDSTGVDRFGILALSNVEQRQILASYLRERNVKNYSASHVDEVLKRLKTSQKSFQFKVAGRVWNVSSTRVCLSEPDSRIT